MDGSKRKRDDDSTIVTFYAPDRTFARVYKGQSLEETKTLVRKKLGISEDTFLRFARLHEGKVVELDDDEDFEAFRHLARHVPMLDVSVFVGQNGPSIFSRQTLGEPSANPNTSKKRNKARKAIPPTSIVSYEATTRDVTPRKEQMTGVPDTGTSTLDVNGVPKKKRKRKGMSPQGELTVSPLVGSPTAPQSTCEGHERASVTSKKSAPKPPDSTVPSLQASQVTVPSPREVSGPSKSSKRKRQDTPGSPVAPGRTSHAMTSSSTTSPSSLAKKLRKEKRSENAESATTIEEQTIARSDKKGKRKTDDAVPTSSEVVPVLADDSYDAVAVRKAAKRAKKDAKAKEREVTEIREEIASSKKDGKRSKKHKTKDTEEVHVADSTSVKPSASHISSEVELAPKKGKGKKRVEAATEPQVVLLDVPVPGASISDEPSKSGKEKKSKAKTRRTEQIANPPMEDAESIEPAASPLGVAEAEVDEEQTGKKSKRKKTMSTISPVNSEGTAPPAHDPSEAASTEGIAIQGVHDDSRSVSVKKSKSDRKKSISAGASSSETVGITPPTGMSVVEAAVQAVLARASSASAVAVPVPLSHEPIPLTSELSIPSRKRKAAKSKLSQAWRPNDLVEAQEQASISTTIPASVSLTPNTKGTNSKQPPRPSSAPTCPICDKVALHPRSQCSIVVAGPVAIRKRISEVKKSGHSELVEELEVLLKEAQGRRKSVGTKPIVESAADPAFDLSARGIPSSCGVPLQSIPTSSRPKPPLGDRSLSSPLVPAGSEISEVAVQSKDEGSSNESSSDDEDEDEGAPASSFLPPSLSLHVSDPDNLEALLYGPVKPRTSILAQIPSSESSSSGEESDDEAEKGEEIDMDEDEKNDRAFRRMSRKFTRAASSSDEDEPQPEPDQVQELDATEGDVGESLVSPPEMGSGPNSSLGTQDAQQVEPDGLAQNTSEVQRSAEQSGEESHVSLEDDADLSEGEGQAKDKPHAQSMAALDEEADSKLVASSDDQLSQSGADERGASPADRGDGHRVEPAAEVDPLASQKYLEVSVEVFEEAERLDGTMHVGEEPKQDSIEVDEAEISAEAPKILRKPEPGLQVDLPQDHVSNDDDPDAGASPAETSLNLSGTTAQAELEKVTALFGHQVEADGVAQGNQDIAEVEVVESHTEDPDDPIDTFSSDHDQDHRDGLDEDPIEDPDMTQERQRSPPPTTPRTPGTRRRMKDRYGRIPQASNYPDNPPLSQQLLGDLVLSQEIMLGTLPTGGALESSLELKTVPDIQMEADAEVEIEKDVEVAEAAKTREATAPSHSQSQPKQAVEAVEARPRRTTRATVRRTSSTAPPSSLPEPQATPTPAAAQRRRGGRLTAEEKAQREAEKAEKEAEKKAERERKAAEKAAERAAKEAEKKAERERKAAERQAEKEAKQAEKEAKQKEKAPARRGRLARGRGGSTKPISTRSQPTAESVEPDEEGVDERTTSAENGETALTTDNVTETPGAAKVSWAVLPQSESRTQEGSVGETSMIDELQPSSPEAAPHHALLEDTATQRPAKEQEDLPMVTPKPKGNKKDPLFIPSSSQHPLTPFGLPNAESTPFGEDDGQDDGENDPDAEPNRTFKAPTRSRASWASQSLYPSLTDLASQSLFSTTQIPSPALFSQTLKQDTSYRLSSVTYGKTKGIDDDSDDDSDESSDDSDDSNSDSGKKKSHIPQNRRAGAGVQKKKKSGLLSAYR